LRAPATVTSEAIVSEIPDIPAATSQQVAEPGEWLYGFQSHGAHINRWFFVPSSEDARSADWVGPPVAFVQHTPPIAAENRQLKRERVTILNDLDYLKSVFEGNVAYPQNGPLASAVRRLTAHV
jgi:hypothetical protein